MSPPPPATLAPTTAASEQPHGAVDDDALLELLVSHGVIPRIARNLAATHSGAMIRQQVEWHPYRSPARNAAGSLVQAIRDAWPPPLEWLEAQEHAAAVARQREEDAARRVEDEARRRDWDARPPEERIAGRLTFWVAGRRRKRQEPTPAEIEAKRAELLAELVTDPPSLSRSSVGR